MRLYARVCTYVHVCVCVCVCVGMHMHVSARMCVYMCMCAWLIGTGLSGVCSRFRRICLRARNVVDVESAYPGQAKTLTGEDISKLVPEPMLVSKLVVHGCSQLGGEYMIV
jgi:hypothetical protein